jgi:outer membrane murein-binding lipoprotein Lpp
MMSHAAGTMTGGPLSAAADATELADAPVRRAAPAGELPAAMGDLVTKFMAATWRQVGCFQDLSERVDRLEQGLDTEPLRDAMLDICLSLQKFAHRTEAGAARAESGIAALADAVELLNRNAKTGREEVQQVRRSIHDQILGFTELVQTVQSRMELLEGSLAEVKESEARMSAHIQILAGKVETLRDQANGARQEAEKSNTELKEQDVQSMARIAELAAEIETLRTRLDAADGEETSLGERLKIAETGLASARERELALAQMYARLAEAYAPVAAPG